MIDYAKYLSIPYKQLGRDVSGCDCWGLLCLVIKNEYGITIPDDRVARRIGEDKITYLSQDFDVVTAPEAGVVGLCRIDGLHAVLFLNKDLFIEMTAQGAFVAKRAKYNNEFFRFYKLRGI